jgi:hypothetical protein
MSVVFVCVPPVFGGGGWLEPAAVAPRRGVRGRRRGVRRLLVLYVIERQDRFEVVTITIAWLTLIVAGVQLGIVFRRTARA